jgi:hypothetical protein
MVTTVSKETRTRSIVSVSEKKQGGKHLEFVTKEEIYTPISEVVESQIEKSWRPKKRKAVSMVLPAITGKKYSLSIYRTTLKLIPSVLRAQDCGSSNKTTFACPIPKTKPT